MWALDSGFVHTEIPVYARSSRHRVEGPGRDKWPLLDVGPSSRALSPPPAPEKENKTNETLNPINPKPLILPCSSGLLYRSDRIVAEADAGMTAERCLPASALLGARVESSGGSGVLSRS